MPSLRTDQRPGKEEEEGVVSTPDFHDCEDSDCGHLDDLDEGTVITQD